jgi:hypothetical protein
MDTGKKRFFDRPELWTVVSTKPATEQQRAAQEAEGYLC